MEEKLLLIPRSTAVPARSRFKWDLMLTDPPTAYSVLPCQPWTMRSSWPLWDLDTLPVTVTMTAGKTLEFEALFKLTKRKKRGRCRNLDPTWIKFHGWHCQLFWQCFVFDCCRVQGEGCRLVVWQRNEACSGLFLSRPLQLYANHRPTRRV